MGRLVDERDAPLSEVDDGRDHERTGEHRGDRQHRAGAGRASDDDEQADAVGDSEGAEMASGVGGGRLPVAQQGGYRDDDDLDGDDSQQRSDDGRCRSPVGEGDLAYDAPRQIRRRLRGERGATVNGAVAARSRHA